MTNKNDYPKNNWDEVVRKGEEFINKLTEYACSKKELPGVFPLKSLLCHLLAITRLKMMGIVDPFKDMMPDDWKTMELFRKAETDAIHWFSASARREDLKKKKPEDFYDLLAISPMMSYEATLLDKLFGYIEAGTYLGFKMGFIKAHYPDVFADSVENAAVVYQEYKITDRIVHSDKSSSDK